MTKAMVLAAGVGSRLDPISQHIPKPLVPVLNTPVISNILYGLKKHGIREVISNTHYLSQTLLDHFDKHPVEELNLRFIHEPELTGDAGGVRACREFLQDGTFVVIMGDLITNADIAELIRAHKEKGAIATIGVKKVSDVTRFGVMKRDEQGFIKAFQEKPKAEEAISNEISTGIYILEPEVFNHIPESGVYGFGRQLFPTLVQKGYPVLGELVHGYWSDIGTIKDLFRANMEALDGVVQLFCGAETNTQSYPNVVLGQKVLIGKNTVIGKGSAIGEQCIIGDDCRIGEDVRMKNCLVFAGSVIEAGSSMENCIYAFGDLISMVSQAVPLGK